MPELIICAGMQRSGSTLQYRIAKEILSKNENLIDLGWISNQNLNEIFNDEENKNKTILFKAHDYNPFYKELEKKFQVRILTSYRDIRDVFVSLMAFNRQTFEDVFSEYEYKRIINNFEDWNNFENKYVGKYEEFTKNIKSEIENIANFLDRNIEENVKNSIYLKVGKTQSNFCNVKYDPDSLLHPNHITDGSSMQWKAKLSKLQLGIIQFYSRDWLLKNNYSIRSTIYNNPLVWKFTKVIWHIKNRTLINRILDKSKLNKRRNLKILESNTTFDLFRLTKRININLYKDSKLSEQISGGRFEIQELAFVDKFLKSGDVFVDVGANIGLFSLIASPKVGDAGTIIAIEPTNSTYNRLKENIALNKFHNISPYKIAISNINGFHKMKVDKSGFDAWNSLSKPTAGIFFEEEEVETKTLDDLIREANLSHINFIKIDVEGWEVPVFEGKNIFSLQNAPVLMVEFTELNAKNAGYSCKQLYKIGENYGYTWYKYDSSNNRLYHTEFKNDYPYENLIAVKNFDDVYRRLVN